MASLDRIIAALLRDVDAALQKNPASNSQIRLEAERVVLCMNVSIVEQPSPDGSPEFSFEVVQTAPQPKIGMAHRLTFEFKIVSNSPFQCAIESGSGLGKSSEAVQTKLHRLDAVEEEQAVKTLSSVFGAPGFDSSARATVFREVFTELADPQTDILIASFSSGIIPDSDATLLTARHRINGVLRSGPLRSIERGGEILAEIFSRYARQLVLDLIERKWKTQQDW